MVPTLVLGGREGVNRGVGEGWPGGRRGRNEQGSDLVLRTERMVLVKEDSNLVKIEVKLTKPVALVNTRRYSPLRRHTSRSC